MTGLVVVLDRNTQADKDCVVMIAAFIQPPGLDAVINQGAVYAARPPIPFPVGDF